jgi:hypothetical protein
VVSSPPYPGVYDYTAEQRLRGKWLHDDRWATEAQRGEIGRRGGTEASDWGFGILDALADAARVARPDAPFYLVIGDGAVDRRAVRVRRLFRHIQARSDAGDLPLRPIAAVGATRPNFHGPSAAAFRDEPRREYLVLLRRA